MSKKKKQPTLATSARKYLKRDYYRVKDAGRVLGESTEGILDAVFDGKLQAVLFLKKRGSCPLEHFAIDVDGKGLGIVCRSLRPTFQDIFDYG